MKTIYSEDHRLHHARLELIDGTLKPAVEMPSRADTVLARVREVGLGSVDTPTRHPRTAIERVHAPAYVAFLEQAWSLWTATGRAHDALPLNWPIRGFRGREPEAIDGKLSYYSFDAGSPITAGTWQAAISAVDVALTGVDVLNAGARSVFSLCRPPGHHAAADYYGGYCFLNNAAIAAQALRDQGAARVAILDVDYHHGNGTQSIFYERSDVYFLSIHGDPLQEFPYFLGYADELGEASGQGFNRNYPLRWGSGFDLWSAALKDACKVISDYRADALVVSLGVDTFEKDPISQFKLKSPDYLEIGRTIAALKLPTLFAMEGGYAVAEIGVNAVNVLSGFDEAAG
ncbi:histone deacetylase family protein [Limibacillus halophilus]|uniref:Acetoin utilization deacetylase AcuC-like enzyme n=1 Tax=Limibacillus halophilus TaxID=1579333 RepID=A0A839SZQ0_9PROT|nr:histone deacetylase family protein [Limibacillus halophilus]MBB3066373.1 acetoin utilization deacetylase AcuC-like enzyme [Limibacillus halophilus]